MNVLVDCGLFQGFKQLRLRNRQPLPIDPSELDVVLLTHAHIDHSGYIPRLCKDGFSKKVYCTRLTRSLCEILLPDSGHLQERDADGANKGGYTRHRPARPLYTEADAEACLRHFKTVDFGTELELGPDVSAIFYPAGHILGAASIRLKVGETSILFSGDVGRYDDPIMGDPVTPPDADYLLLESTYGDRQHSDVDPEDALEAVINRTLDRGGTVLIPSFAVGRAQTLLYHLWRLQSEERIPDVPIYLDSPMAANVSDLFEANADQHRLNPAQARAACATAIYTRKGSESRRLDADRNRKIIISASGMATGGRILYHLKAYGGDPRNTILFAGFQAGGTRGAHMLDGADRVKIHGGYWPIRAEVQTLSMLSAHADSDELMRWVGKLTSPPETTFIVHGEANAADRLRHRIEETLNWSCRVPEHGEILSL